VKLCLAVVLLVAALTPNSRAEERTVKLLVDNMSCGACPYIVREALSAIPGVIAVAVSFADKSAVVTFDDRLARVKDLAAAVTESGFPSRPAPSEE
jgi:mercuric ion binding protein